MTRISKEGEYTMKHTIVKLCNHVESLVTDALNSENIDIIIHNSDLIKGAVSRMHQIEEKSNPHAERKNLYNFFYKTSEDALRKIERHLEKIQKEMNVYMEQNDELIEATIKEGINRVEQPVEEYTEEDVESFETEEEETLDSVEQPMEEYTYEGVEPFEIGEEYPEENSKEIDANSINLDTIEKMYEEAIKGDLSSKENIKNQFQYMYEKLLELSRAEDFSNDEIGYLYQMIDNLHTYRKNLDSQIEKEKSVSYIDDPSPLSEEKDQMTMEKMYDLQQEAIESGNCDRMVEVSNELTRQSQALYEKLMLGEIPSEQQEVAKDRLDLMTNIIRDLDSRVEEIRKTAQSKFIVGDFPTEEEMNAWYQEAMVTSNLNRLTEVLNYFNACIKEIDFRYKNGGYSLESGIFEKLESMVDDMSKRLDTMNFEIQEEGFKFLTEEEVEALFQEAMMSSDYSRVVEIANQLDEYQAGLVDDNERTWIKEKVGEIDLYLANLENTPTENANELNELMEKIEEKYQEALETPEITRKQEIKREFEEEYKNLEDNLTNSQISYEDRSDIQDKMRELEEYIYYLDAHIKAFSPSPLQETKKKGIKNLFVNINWFHKDAKKKKEKTNKKLSLKRAAIFALGIGTVVAALCTAVSAKAKSRDSKKMVARVKEVSDGVLDICSAGATELQKKRLEDVVSNSVSVALQVNNSLAEASKSKILTQDAKEEKIMDLVRNLRDRFNMHDGMNITTEQALSLYIHLNAANSYENANDTLALDKITRENLIKKYYVGLTENSEAFKTYELEDEDLSRLSADVHSLRNAALNRVIVLNSQGKYAESREIIRIFKDFVTEEALQDEVAVLTESIEMMQTSDKAMKKREIYRYYNYIFAGPKNGVRNFNQYGHYVDENNKEMTYENQGTTMRFYTWMMDGFVGLNLNNNIIPQDIINAKEAKLRDQSSLLRILGFKNCNSIDYNYDFDTPIDNKTKKSSTKSSRSTSKSSSSNKNIASVLETPELDKEMDAGLRENTNVGDTFKLGDGSTVTVVESGPSEATVVVQPDPSSAKTEDTTPEGSKERETTEGGGNEKTEEISFEQDSTDVVIDEGGDVISDGSDEYEEEISFEEDSTEEYYEEEISFEQDSTEEYSEEEISFEQDLAEEYSEEAISFEEPSVSEQSSQQAEIYQLYSLREELLNAISYTQEPVVFDEGYAKIYHI